MQPLFTTSPVTFWFLIFLPVIAYWLIGGIFVAIEWSGRFEKYRLHTPTVRDKRNRVTAKDCFRKIIGLQIVSISFSLALELAGVNDGPEPPSYNEQLNVNAHRSIVFRHGVSWLLAAFGLNTSKIASNLSAKDAASWDVMAEILAPGAAITQFDTAMARVLYWVLIPTLQFGAAFVIGDLWQYLSHRALHENQFLYKHVHAAHHKLDVPYCWGASYETYWEAFIAETLGGTMSLQVGRLSPTQAMAFIIYSVLKASYDHCGYQFPYDPFRLVGFTNPLYHDIHHQRWGRMYNYSQSYSTLWDVVFGTNMPYEKAKELYVRDDVANPIWALEKMD